MAFDISNHLTIQLRKLGAAPGVHLLLPAGIGDCAWVMGKLHAVAKRKNTTVWLPEGEQQRAGQYLQMIGVKHGYLPGLTTNWVWKRAGSPALPDRGWCSVQANSHLESGRRIEEWYPGLELSYPRLKVQCKDTYKAKYALVFPGSRNYMNGNLDLSHWVAVTRQLKEMYGQVRLIGAGRDTEFVEEIVGRIGGAGHLLDRTFDEVAAAFLSDQCQVFAGVASGPLIAATIEGAKTFLAYPDHLSQMPGTWEPSGSRTGWCFVKDLPKQLSKVAI